MDSWAASTYSTQVFRDREWIGELPSTHPPDYRSHSVALGSKPAEGKLVANFQCRQELIHIKGLCQRHKMPQKWAMAVCLLEGPVGRTLRAEGFHRHPTFSPRFLSTLFFLSTYSPTNVFSSMPCASTLEQRPSYPDITFPHWTISPRLGGTWNYLSCVHPPFI